MTVITDICNDALDLLGKAVITDIEEGSNEAIRCKRTIERARRAALKFNPWSFSRKRQALALRSTNDREDVWTYSYDRPNDCEHFIRLLNPTEREDTQTPAPDMHAEQGRIYTHIEQAHAFYVYDAENYDEWPVDFTEAVAYKLAALLAPGMTRRKVDVTELNEAYMRKVMEAAESDAAQYPDGYAYPGYRGSEGTMRQEVKQADGSTIWR